jgi:hypothetical protein
MNLLPWWFTGALEAAGAISVVALALGLRRQWRYLAELRLQLEAREAAERDRR